MVERGSEKKKNRASGGGGGVDLRKREIGVFFLSHKSHLIMQRSNKEGCWEELKQYFELSKNVNEKFFLRLVGSDGLYFLLDMLFDQMLYNTCNVI